MKAVERGATADWLAGCLLHRLVVLVQSQSHSWLSRMGIYRCGRKMERHGARARLRRSTWYHATFARLSGEETSSFDSPRSSDTVNGACLAFLR